MPSVRRATRRGGAVLHPGEAHAVGRRLGSPGGGRVPNWCTSTPASLRLFVAWPRAKRRLSVATSAAGGGFALGCGKARAGGSGGGGGDGPSKGGGGSGGRSCGGGIVVVGGGGGVHSSLAASAPKNRRRQSTSRTGRRKASQDVATAGSADAVNISTATLAGAPETTLPSPKSPRSPLRPPPLSAPTATTFNGGAPPPRPSRSASRPKSRSNSASDVLHES